MKADIVAYTDGGARGNPGPAGAGVAIFDGAGNPLKELNFPLGHQTNNWAEYEAVYQALLALKKMYGAKLKTMKVQIKLDSQLIARQLSNEYQIKEETLFPQYIKVHNLLISSAPNTTFTYIPREQNKDADRLSNVAMDQV